MSKWFEAFIMACLIALTVLGCGFDGFLGGEWNPDSSRSSCRYD